MPDSDRTALSSGLDAQATADPQPASAPALREVPAPQPPSSEPRTWLLRLAGLGVPLLVLFSKLASGGIWDPYELNVADLARRIAIHLWGAQSLGLANADNTMPMAETLGQGELPFTSIALGFATFGLHEWAGRLPLALWAMAGVGATYWLFKRMIDERAAAYASIVLTTMPLYFVQGRTMLGDIVTMAAVAIATAGLTVAVFDRTASDRTRLASVAMGVVGVAAAFMSRGLLIGASLPLLAVGLAWLVAVGSSHQDDRPRLASAIGAASLVAGVAAALVGWGAFADAEKGMMSRILGVPIDPPSQMPTFDYVIMWLGHSLFPWSAFIPFAAGRLFRAPRGVQGIELQNQRDLRLVLLVGAAVAYGALTLVAPKTGYVPFAGPMFLAGMAAVAVRDLERGAPASRTLAIGVAVFLGLFYQDFKRIPEKGLSAFGVDADRFPDTFRSEGATLVLIAAAVMAVLSFASWLERDEPGRKAFDRNEYLRLPQVVRTTANGNVAFLLVVVEAALAGFALLFFIGLKVRWKPIITMSANVRMIAMNAWWVAPLALVVVVLGALAFRDLCRLVFPALRISRASATMLGGAVAGAILSFSYYPALAGQLSPKEVFDSYARMHQSGEKLALLGVNNRVASYYSDGTVQTFSDVQSAFNWLNEATERRWLVIRNEDLPKLNSIYRGRVRPQANLPILDARSSQILLASNKLREHENNLNPLRDMVLPERPQPTHPLDINLDNQVRAIGWDIVDSQGKPVRSVVAGRRYRMRLYYECIGRITRDWQSFIHIDGFQRRFNGDHKPMEGKYPMTLWQPGDYLVDDYPFALEPNFTPGAYTLYYGFFSGDTRLKVVSGKHHENRVEGGPVQVQ